MKSINLTCPKCNHDDTKSISSKSVRFDEKLDDKDNYIFDIRACKKCKKTFVAKFYVTVTRIVTTE